MASSDPIRDRWTAWTAVTTPIDGRAMRARSAISPPTYMPISSTAAPCSGPRSSTVSGRPTSLLRLPSVRRVVNRRDRTAAIASLDRRLGDAARHPDDERLEPAAPAGRHGAEGRQAVGDTDDRDVARGIRRRDGTSHEDGGGPARDGVVDVVVAVGALARQRHEQAPRRDEAGVHRGSPDRSIGPCHEPAAGQADQLVGRQRRAGRARAAGAAGRCRSRAFTGPDRVRRSAGGGAGPAS